jgi:hypothetical protein
MEGTPRIPNFKIVARGRKVGSKAGVAAALHASYNYFSLARQTNTFLVLVHLTDRILTDKNFDRQEF